MTYICHVIPCRLTRLEKTPSGRNTPRGFRIGSGDVQEYVRLEDCKTTGCKTACDEMWNYVWRTAKIRSSVKLHVWWDVKLRLEDCKTTGHKSRCVDITTYVIRGHGISSVTIMSISDDVIVYSTWLSCSVHDLPVVETNLLGATRYEWNSHTSLD